MAIDINENIKFFEETLRSTGKERVEDVIRRLKNKGFYKAPASSNFHLNEEGGLLQHSINVYKMAMAIKEQVVKQNPELESSLNDSSIAIAALLHDICKTDIYFEAEKFRKDSNDRWEKYRGYNVDYSNFPMGHGEKSVIMLLCMGLCLTEDEMLAIRWHMGPWDMPFQSAEEKASLNAAKEKCPLVSVIQAADGLAASLIEVEFNKN